MVRQASGYLVNNTMKKGRLSYRRFRILLFVVVCQFPLFYLGGDQAKRLKWNALKFYLMTENGFGMPWMQLHSILILLS